MRLPPVASRDRRAAEDAMYVNWSAVVAPAGLHRRPTMIMSRNVMNQCWSWDHGWDNATVFDDGCPVAAPDLASYLVLQMDMLAQMAERMGRPRAAAGWKRRADALLERMLGKLWRDDRFVSICLPTGKPVEEGDFLLNAIPIILGQRLPKRQRDVLAVALRPGGRFVTS